MVDPVSTAVFTATKVPPRKNSEAQESQASGSVTAGDIQHSKSLSQLLGLAKQLAEQGPPVDYQKIAHIRHAIAEGSYKINPNALAEAMLDFATEEKK